MQSLPKTWLISILIAGAFPLLAGTLAQAPFQLTVPGKDWTLDDSNPQELGVGMVIAASLINEKAQQKSIVMTGPIKPSATAFDQMCLGIRDSFANPAIKKLSDETTLFLGHKAQAFAYEVTQPGVETTYNEARVFIVDNRAWVISASGPLDQKEAIRQILTFYHPRKE